MAMICALCAMDEEKLMESPLMPHVVVYKGYSLCEEHFRLYRGWCKTVKGLKTEAILEFMKSKTEPATPVPDFVGDDESVTQHEEPKLKKRKRKSKKKKGAKK